MGEQSSGHRNVREQPQAQTSESAGADGSEH